MNLQSVMSMPDDLPLPPLSGRTVSLAMLAVLFLGCSGTTTRSLVGVDPTPPGVLFVGRDEYFDIAGSTARQLDSAMQADQRSPERAAGRHAYTLRWSYESQVSGVACEVLKPRVTISTLDRLPRWKPPAEASDTLRAQWAAFAASLEAHAQGHRRIATDAARQIQAALMAQRTLPCDVLGRTVNQAAREVQLAHDAAQERYDAATEHGVSQGAVWPPR